MRLNKRLSVLYAENNEDSGFMLLTLLAFSGIDVQLARSVREAVQSAENRHFDLYLLDGIFPDGRGLELFQRLRAISPQTPIVFYSGEAYESDRQKAMNAGADAYLIKPEVNTVASTILHLLPEFPVSGINTSLPSRESTTL